MLTSVSIFLRVGVDENKVAVVVLSPLKMQTMNGGVGVEIVQNKNNSNLASSRQQQLDHHHPERPKSADRISHYGKSRSRGAHAPAAVVGRKRRYKVHSSQLKKKKSIMVVSSSNLRSYRSLILKAGLRSGTVRKKHSFVNLKQTRRPGRPKRTAAEPALKPEPPQKIPSVVAPTPVRRNSRVSVDSAVSSSTSAERQNASSKHRAAAAATATSGGATPEAAKLPLPSQLRTMKNPLNRANGEVQMAYYVADRIIVVQQELISFWECSKLASLLGLQQELQLAGQLKRAQSGE